jgi:hypothetical protein
MCEVFLLRFSTPFAGQRRDGYRAATTKAAQERRGTAMRDAEDDEGHEGEGESEDEDKRDSNGN